MDPKANLTEQILLARRIAKAYDEGGDYDTACAIKNGQPERTDLAEIASDAARLAELVLALHEWIRGGGFSPYYVGKI